MRVQTAPAPAVSVYACRRVIRMNLAALRLAQPLVVILADLINDGWQQITPFHGHASSSPSIPREMNT